MSVYLCTFSFYTSVEDEVEFWDSGAFKAWVCIEKFKVIYLLKHFIKKIHISYVTVIYGHL